MRFIRFLPAALALLAFGVTALPARALDLNPGEREAIAAVIQKQFDAFARDDGEAAFAQAAPEIRTMFGAADLFMRMVREAYAPVYRHRDAAFAEIKDGPTLIVTLTGEDGRHWVAFYQMILGEDGVWRIKGCNLIEDPDQHA